MITFTGVTQAKFDSLSGQLTAAGSTVTNLDGGAGRLYAVEGSGVKCKVTFDVAGGRLDVQPDNLVARMASGRIRSTLAEYLAAPIPAPAS